MTGLAHPTDVSDMYAIHAAFRRAFAEVPDLVASAGPEDVERQVLVGDFYRNVLALLAVHHDGEDVILWPLLHERLPEHADLFAQMEAMHAALHPAIDDASAALAAWSDSPHADTAAAFVSAMAAVERPLLEHLDSEESDALPLMSRVITPEEWGQLPQHGQAHYGGDRFWLALGLIREQMTAQQLEKMDAAMPPPAVEFWTTAGEPMFTDFVGRLRS